jgi:hypothetical protein
MAARPAMHKDANLRKRNALVIPGGLLAVHALAGMLYVRLLRSDGGTCGDAALMVFAGACRPAVLVMAIPLVVGLALVGTGAVAFRSRATCRHGHGSWTHFTLALLVSLVTVPLLGIGLAPSLVGDGASIVQGGVNYPISSILGGLSLLGILMLLPFAFLYAGQVRANPCCTERGCFSPCFCDEAPAEEAPAEESVPVVAAAPPPPADDWQVVNEAEAPGPAPSGTPLPEPVPAPWPPEGPARTETASATTVAGGAPVAAQPADPAAPPSDEMAHAVEWAQEEEEEADKGAEAAGEGAKDKKGEAADKPTRRRRTASRPAKKAKPKKE